MRGIALGVMAGAAALFAAAPADARTSELGGDLQATGAVTISWHGDAARGCAEAGLCGYSGSIGLHPDDGQYDFTITRRGLREGFGFLDLLSTPPLVRVRRTEAGSEDGACVDQAGNSSIEVTVARAGPGRARLGLDALALSPGRCAGPELSNLLARLPHRTRSLAGLTRRRPRLDFSGHASFARGRFSGVVRSTLRLRFRHASPATVTNTQVGPPTGRRPRVRVVHVHALYRVTRFAGALSTTFGGFAEPSCADFDACGVTGSSNWTMTPTAGTFAIEADARAHRADHGIRGALAAIRRGPANAFGEARLLRDVGITTADVSRAGGARCHDSASVPSPGVTAGSFLARRLTFELGGEDVFTAGLLRTGCPGPSDDDVAGLPNPATGSAPLSALGRRSFVVRMRGTGPLGRDGYSGTRSADFTLELRRVSIRAVYKRARGI